MNTYRNVAAALAVCAAFLSLAACSAGITSAPAATTAATTSSSPSRSAAASSSASDGRMVEVSGSIGRFPVPAGAKVAENVSTSSGIGIMFSKVTPAKVQSFYTQALPRAGYRITGDQSVSGIMLMQFTGHGYKGTVSTMANADPKDTLPGLGTKNVTSVLLEPK